MILGWYELQSNKWFTQIIVFAHHSKVQNQRDKDTKRRTHHSKVTYYSPLYLEIQSYGNKFTTYKGDTKLDRLPKDQVKDFSIHIFQQDPNIWSELLLYSWNNSPSLGETLKWHNWDQINDLNRKLDKY